MRILGEKLRDGVRIIGDHLGWGGKNRGKYVNWGENIGTNGGTSMKRCSEKEQPSTPP